MTSTGTGGSGWGNWNAPQVAKAKVWATDCFVSEFCDHFADDLTTSSEVFESWSSYGKALHFLAEKMEDTEVFPPELAKKARPVIESLVAQVDKSEMMMRKYSSFQQWKMQYYLSKMLDDIAKGVHAMDKEGDMCLFPLLLPDTHDSGVCMIVEYLDRENVRVTVINPTATTKFHPKVVGSDDPTKLKQQVALTVSKVKKSKICSEAWWSCTMLGATMLNNEDVFYTHFLSWLTGRTHEGQIADYQTEAYYATPAKSSVTVFWKSLIHALKYTLRIAGMDKAEVKFVRHFVKLFLLQRASEDLDKVKSIKFGLGACTEEIACAFPFKRFASLPSIFSAVKQRCVYIEKRRWSVYLQSPYPQIRCGELAGTNSTTVLRHGRFSPTRATAVAERPRTPLHTSHGCRTYWSNQPILF